MKLVNNQLPVTDSLLARYNALKETEKSIAEEIATIRDAILAAGNTETEHFLAVIQEQERQTVAAKAKFDEQLGHGWLETNGLLNRAVVKLVKVIKK